MRQLERKTQGQQQKKSQANHQQQMAELIQQHEQKLRKQLTELQTLRRKHTQLVNTSATARSQHENTIRQLRTNLDGCKHEKKKLLKRIKLDAQRHQQQVHDWEKKCATLERQVSQAKRQQDHDLPKIKDFAKPSSSSTTTTHQQQLDALLAHVKKARDRHDWSLLSAKDLAPFRLPGKSNASSTSSSTTNSSTHRNATAKRGMHRASSRLGARMKSKLPTLPPSTDDKLDAIKRAIQSQSQRPIASRKLIPFVEKRQRLQQEQEELLKERLLIIEAEETHNQMERQYMDDRINQITLELDMIQSLLQQVDTEKGDDNDDVLSRSLLRQVTTMDDWVPLGEWFLRQVLESKQDQRLALMISGLLEKVLAKYQAAWDWLHQQPTSDQDRSFIEQAQMKCIDAQQVHLWNGLLLPQSPSSLPPLVTDSLSLSASNSDYTTITNPIDHPCGFDSTCKLPPSNDTIDTTTLV
ncbi:hypothetical protein DM01DRAFT_1053939 [Hesseltinella vesiculosa]|uniref:Uncharacterized protein n=1 Tax=Hesseltinella vesiculosa TaxID=101127 RepID=A0A1X2GFG1_9FUNG|nr:hypothetical protein DM01DRAFT_1053939 [Hesseltinella vesiculosa]